MSAEDGKSPEYSGQRWEYIALRATDLYLEKSNIIGSNSTKYSEKIEDLRKSSKKNPGLIVGILNMLGSDGWELVTTTQESIVSFSRGFESGPSILFFKRPISK